METLKKKTPVKVYVKEKEPVDFAGCQVFGNGDKIVFGDWAVVQPILAENADKIEDFVVENDCRNSAIPLLDMKNIKLVSNRAHSFATRLRSVIMP